MLKWLENFPMKNNRVSEFSLKVYESRYIVLFVVSRFTGKLLKAFLSWLCRHFLFSIKRWLYFFNRFFNRLKVWGYPTLLLSWFINFKWNQLDERKIYDHITRFYMSFFTLPWTSCHGNWWQKMFNEILFKLVLGIQVTKNERFMGKEPRLPKS